MGENEAYLAILENSNQIVDIFVGKQDRSFQSANFIHQLIRMFFVLHLKVLASALVTADGISIRHTSA
jgi:hypothetical protein